MNKELIKNGGLILTLIVILILFLFYILNSNPNPNSNQSIASSLIDQNSVLATGINFDTGESIIFDPLTEKEITPCNQIAIAINQKNITTKNRCKVTESEIDAPAAVLDAIKNSKQLFEGFVMKDGEKIPSKFTIAVSALYEGSMCNTYWSAGTQSENCITVKQRCNSYVPSRQHQRIDRVPGLRQTCTELSSSWPDQFIP